MFNKKNYYIGFTLIELMITLVITSFLLTFIVKIFLGMEASYSTQVALNTLEENANMFNQLIEPIVNASGYIGCPRLTEHFPLVNHTEYLYTSANKLELASDVDAKENTQVLVVRYSEVKHVDLLKDMRSLSVLYLTKGDSFSKDDIVIISDCKNADMFVIKENVELQDGTQKMFSKQNLSKLYKRNSSIMLYRENTYLISETGRKNSQGLPINALYVKDIDHRKMELLEGVESMHLTLDRKGAGVAFALTFKSVNDFYLEKQWFNFVMSRN